MKDLSLDEPALHLSSHGLAALMDAVVERGIPFRFRANGDSMKPAIRDGDVITISPPRRGEPRVGQVAACRMPGAGNLLVHRVIRRRDEKVLIRSDRLRTPDGWVPREQLYGVVTAVERDGRPILWLWKGSCAGLAFLMLGKLWAREVMGWGFQRVKRLAGKGSESEY